MDKKDIMAKITIAQEAYTKKWLLKSKLLINFQLRVKLIKYFIYSISLRYGLLANATKSILSISRWDEVINKEVLQKVRKKDYGYEKKSKLDPVDIGKEVLLLESKKSVAWFKNKQENRIKCIWYDSALRQIVEASRNVIFLNFVIFWKLK